MNIIDKIKALVREMFASEMIVSDNLHHDPFKGHIEDDHPAGKSYFGILDEAEYVGYDSGDGFCNAGSGMPNDIALRKVSEQESDSVRIIVFEAIPTRIVFEGCGAIALYRDANDDEKDPIPVGFDVVTKRTCSLCDVVVKTIHGCLQLAAPKGGFELVENETTRFTVVLTKEDQGWAVASVHPGEAGEDIGKYLAEAGFVDGEKFYNLDLDDEEQKVVNPPSWLFDHLVEE